MRVKDLKKLDIDALKVKVTDLKTKLLELRLDTKLGKEKNTAQIKSAKKTIARAMTILSDQIK